MLAGLLLLSLSAVFVSAESPDKNKGEENIDLEVVYMLCRSHCLTSVIVPGNAVSDQANNVWCMTICGYCILF